MHAPICLPPISDIEPSTYELPYGSCDTHAHVIASDTSMFPFVADRTYTPPSATEERYLQMLDAQGMTRGVLVQISVYGTDNRYMLGVLKRHPDRLRGVAVVGPEVKESTLVDLHEAGVRGVRLNVLFKGGVGIESMDRIAHKIKDLGWHMQFLMDCRQLPELMPAMIKLPVPGVIDHMGHMPVEGGINNDSFSAIRHLLQNNGWWVKLSGAYRISNKFDSYLDVTPWAQELVKLAPDRVLWGSDWPHVHLSRMVNTGTLRNQLSTWVPDQNLRKKILVTNPGILYGF